MIKQTDVRRRRGAELLALACCALLPVAAHAQTAAPAKDANAPTLTKEAEESFVLSPFEVNASADRGYLATSTLAGSRLNTSLLQTPSAISVFTKDFLSDIAAGSVADAALYALNATPLIQSSPSASFEANIFSPNSVEFRGFGAGGQARNYFQWPADSDTYNVERLDFSRGPNSILFGSGVPGGIINVTPKRAELSRNKGAVSVRVGSWDSYRSTFDYNFVLKRDVLAARVNAVWEDSGSWINHGFTRRNGLHGAATYRPFKNTTLRLDAEKLEQDRNIARTYPLLDFYSGWTGTTLSAPGAALPANAGLARIGTNLPVAIYDAHDGVIRNWLGEARTQTDRGSTLEPMLGRTQNFAGPDDRNDSRTDNFTVMLEQRLFDKLYMEAAYNRTNYEIALNRPLLAGASNSSNYAVHIDPNVLLPGGAPNPNVGLPYTEGNWNKQWQGNDTQDYRFTASYELNFGRWLGRHQFAGLIGRRDEGFHSTVARETDVNRVFAPTATIDSAALQIIRRHYLKYGDGAAETGLKNIDGVNGIDSEFIVWAGNQLTEQVTRQDYKQLSMVSTFLDDRLTLIGGLRNDEFKLRSKAGRAQNTPLSSFYVTGDYGAWGTPAGKNTTSYGAVLKLTDNFYAYANYSENFNNQNARVPILGSDGKFTLGQIPPRAGIGKDFGLRFQGFDGRLYASVGYYETNETDRTFFWIGAVNTQAKIIIDKLEPGQWIANFQDTSDTDGKGYEVEITANPTPRWRITANASKKQTELSKQGANFKSLFAQKEAAWLATNDTAVINAMNIIRPLLTSFTKDGQRRLGEREYTANLYTNYEFAPESKLHGFTVGGGVRFLGPALVGYDLNSSGQLVEFDGNEDITVDLNVIYRRKLAQKRNLTVQLNVKNVLEDYAIQRVGIVSASFDQDGGTIIYKQPRQFLLSATVTF